MTFKVTGAQGEIGFPMPTDGACSGGGLLVIGRGPITRDGGTVRASGRMQSSLFPSIDWTITIRSATLAYRLDVRFVVQFPDTPACPGSGVFTGTLAKQ